MKTQTIVYVTDMTRSVAFYSGLGFEKDGPESEYWTAFKAGSETLALHLAESVTPNTGSVTLSLAVDGSLEDVAADLAATGIDSTEIIAQPFGRSFTITDPDGLVIQVNEHQS